MEVINVHIGEVRVGRENSVLQAILGSCVGIAFIWRERRLCGLAHCLLPNRGDENFTLGARYVDQAVTSLFRLLNVRAQETSQIEAILAGGGNMTCPAGFDDSKLVGAVNARSARAELARHGVSVVFCDVGGEEGRKIFVDCGHFTYRVEKIPRIIEAT
jgi:chemotaxis protein CheD